MSGYEEYDPPSAEEETAEWGGDVGAVDGYERCIGEEGRDALAQQISGRGSTDD